VPPLTTYTVPLTLQQVEALKAALKEEGFEFETKPYTIFAARKQKLNIAVYEKGPKVLIQGKGLEDFVGFVLEPRVLGEARLGYEEVHHPDRFEPHFGVDESGKGDFFGPLVIAGVYVDGPTARALVELGVQDSKAIGSDKKIRALAAGIRRLGVVSEVVQIGPERYNALYAKFRNVNSLLAWGHARIIENLCARKPDCRRALSDKFADERVIERALMERGRALQMDQRTKAESDYAVAAASILAREKFIDWMDSAADRVGAPLPRGASAEVKRIARGIVERLGNEALPGFAKMHFKTASEVLGATSD